MSLPCRKLELIAHRLQVIQSFGSNLLIHACALQQAPQCWAPAKQVMLCMGRLMVASQALLRRPALGCRICKHMFQGRQRACCSSSLGTAQP